MIKVSLLNISDYYNQNKQSDKAIESLNMLKPYINEQTDLIYSHAYSLNMGDAYFYSKKYEEARINYLNALSNSGSPFSGELKTLILGNLGEIELALGNIDKALEYFNSKYATAKHNEELISQIEGLISLGNIYQKNYYKKAMDAYMEAEYLSKENTSTGFLDKIYEGVSKTYSAKGDFKNAYKTLYKSLAIKDSIGYKNKESLANQGLFDFDVELQEKKIEVLEKEGIIKEIRAKRQKHLLYGTVIILILILLLAIGAINRFRQAKKTNIIIQQERDRSEKLLLNILPAEIAEELKANGSAEARDFDLVSILFTDFKEFTKISQILSAKELVNEINHCFKAFDDISDKYGIEKIKTIGDSFMAAGGMPIQSNESAKNTILAALEMQSFISERIAQKQAKNEIVFEMRLGIHTGPVVAGIVGVKKFQYDVWGDTVNTASRMQSNGEVGKVNISEHTFELIKDDPNFSFEKRGKIQVKGKGEMEMYFVSLNEVA